MEPDLPGLDPRRKRRGLVLLGVVLALAAPLHALDPLKSISQFTHTSWSAKDGLPAPVRAIVQTGDGYLWLGTEAGLYRFDGLRFALWEPSFGERLPGSFIWSLCTARDGSLWIGFSSGGISRLRNGRVESYSPADGTPSGGVLSIVEDRRGTIWAGGQYGFSRFDGGRWLRVGAEMGYPAPGAQSLLVDRGGDLWAATDGLNFGFSRDPVRRNTILKLGRNGDRFVGTGEAVGMVWRMSEAPDGAVWIADTSGRKARPIRRSNLPGAEIEPGGESMCLLVDPAGSLWIGLIEGGVRRVRNLQRPSDAPLDRFEPGDGLSGGLVYSTFQDREGNIWIGTAGGLDRFSENKVTSFSAREGLDPDQQIALTGSADGGVWIVSYTRDSVRQLRHGLISTYKLPSYLPSDSARILSLFADRHGQVWVGGNFKLARKSDGGFAYAHSAELTQGTNVEAIADDGVGGLWISVTGWNAHPGTSSASAVLRFRDGEWSDFSARPEIPRYRCRVLYADPRGRVWLGFESGEVVVYDGGRFRPYAMRDGLPGGRVLAITSDRAGHVWVGGEGGLSRFVEPGGGRFATLTRRNGLPGSSVSGIVEDDDGFLWLAGSLAILRVDPRELERAVEAPSYRVQGKSFDATDGLRGLPRQREPFPTATRAADGRLWFATTGGIAVIDSRHWHSNVVPPPVAIEAVKADGRFLLATSGLKLKPKTRDLEFRYTALSLTDPQRVRFRYKLEGYDAEWHGPVSTREATYTNLPPRSYRFRVTACNNDGLWNDRGATLAFAILPAFYQTSWFLALCTAAAGYLAWAGYRWRVRQVASRLDLQFRERLDERTRIAQDLHDTLLQGCISASMQLYVAVDELPAALEGRQRLSRVLQLMGRVIEEGRNAVRGLRSPAPQSADVNDLALALSRIPQELEFSEAARLRVVIGGRHRPLRPLIRDEVYRIGREAVVNAVRHSGAAEIEVEIELGARTLRVRIRDNGRGIDPEILRSGRDGHWGLSGMRERAETMGARFSIRSRAQAGTEVELTVPAVVAFVDRP